MSKIRVVMSLVTNANSINTVICNCWTNILSVIFCRHKTRIVTLLAPCFTLIFSLAYSPTLQIEAIYSSETPVDFHRITQLYRTLTIYLFINLIWRWWRCLVLDCNSKKRNLKKMVTDGFTLPHLIAIFMDWFILRDPLHLLTIQA
jgi:hypothetical protein